MGQKSQGEFRAAPDAIGETDVRGGPNKWPDDDIMLSKQPKPIAFHLASDHSHNDLSGLDSFANVGNVFDLDQ